MMFEIDRINNYDDKRFSDKVLKQHGAFLINGNDPYEVEIISKSDAVVRGENPVFYDKVIEEFRIYAEHITNFVDEDNNLIRKYDAVDLFRIPIKEIQPSQFYVDIDKKKAVAEFVDSEEDVIIPLTKWEERYASLDGHTRLKVAIDKGFNYVYGFVTDTGDFINYFIEGAMKRNIYSPYDIVELGHEEYEIKWNRFCEMYFENQEWLKRKKAYTWKL